MTVSNPRDQRSLTVLISDLARDAVTLVRQEIQLAKAEASEKISDVGMIVAGMAVGGLIVFAGFLVLLDACVYFIAAYFSPEVPLWLSALGVGAVVTGIGVILVLQSRKALSAQSMAPRRTVDSLSRDKDLLKESLQ